MSLDTVTVPTYFVFRNWSGSRNTTVTQTEIFFHACRYRSVPTYFSSMDTVRIQKHYVFRIFSYFVYTNWFLIQKYYGLTRTKSFFTSVGTARFQHIFSSTDTVRFQKHYVFVSDPNLYKLWTQYGSNLFIKTDPIPDYHVYLTIWEFYVYVNQSGSLLSSVPIYSIRQCNIIVYVLSWYF